MLRYNLDVSLFYETITLYMKVLMILSKSTSMKSRGRSNQIELKPMISTLEEVRANEACDAAIKRAIENGQKYAKCVNVSDEYLFRSLFDKDLKVGTSWKNPLTLNQTTRIYLRRSEER